jgi:hypothetical protein
MSARAPGQRFRCMRRIVRNGEGAVNPQRAEICRSREGGILALLQSSPKLVNDDGRGVVRSRSFVSNRKREVLCFLCVEKLVLGEKGLFVSNRNRCFMEAGGEGAAGR